MHRYETSIIIFNFSEQNKSVLVLKLIYTNVLNIPHLSINQHIFFQNLASHHVGFYPFINCFFLSGLTKSTIKNHTRLEASL